VHVNTLRHRLERVETLTKRALDSTGDRVDLWLALQVATVGALADTDQEVIAPPREL
jgi:DNA-binding PucR family transcriptional regulator